MRATEFITEAVKQRLDPKCWKGKHKEGTKIKGGIRVNNCVPNESVEEAVAPGQYAKLYHSTPLHSLDAILQSGYLAPTGNPAYLSLTRDSKLDYGSWGGEFVEFDIDQNAVRQRIKLEPYNHSDTMGGPRATGGGESEERTRQKIPLKRFVTAMHAPTGWEGDKAGEHYGNLLKKYGVPIVYDIVPILEEQGVAEGQEHLDRIRSLSGLGEAIKLDAPYREFGGQEFQDYLTRIKGTPKIDNKTGQVKVGKSKISKKTGEVIPGKEQYVSGKIKKDKYTMPYIHRSSVITYLGPDGKTFSEDKIIAALKQRPVALLKQNEKMKHSNNEFEQFFNMGFAALTGIAVDESTNKLIIVNTCPGAGSCQVDCFMLAGGKIQFAGPWLSDGRNLTFILNDPEGYFKKMSDEIAKELRDGQKGSKKFPTGWQVSIRWHDAGDFFSKDYLDMTLKLAQQFPDVKFYAYTKMANAAMSKKLPNFIINWSEGAKSAQAKQVKAQDPNLERTKNSRIVPQDMFWDLLKKDEKGNLDKEGADAEGEGGRWVTRDPAATNELKQRLAKEYRISVNSILNYDEYLAKRKSIPQGMTYNVIVAPGEGDISAADRGVLSTLLLKHGNA